MLTALIVSALFRPQASLLVNQPTPTVRIGAKDVPLQFPVDQPGETSPSPGSSTLEQDGWTYIRQGTSITRTLAGGGWTQAKELWSRASASAATKKPWRVKVFLFTRTQIVEKGADGVYRPRRGTMDATQLEETYKDLARFKALAEGASNGQIAMTFDVVEVNDLARNRPDGSVELFDKRFVEDWVAPKVNTAPFDADDKTYRGPYNSVFVLSAALSRIAGTYDIGVPCSVLSIATDRRANRLGGIAQSMAEAWSAHVTWNARKAGYDLESASSESAWPTLPYWLTPAMWTAAADLSPPPEVDWLTRRYRVGAKAGLWSEAQGDPMAKLPLFIPGPTASAIVGDYQEGFSDSGRTTFVRAEYADLFGKLLRGATAVGTWTQKDRSMIAFRDSLLAVEDFGWKPNASQSSEASLPDPTPIGELALTAKSATDPEVGDAIEVADLGSLRRGSALLYARQDGRPLLDTAKTPVVEFSVKLPGSLPYEVRFLSSGRAVGRVLLGSARPGPRGPENVRTLAQATQSPDWQKVVADFRMPGPVEQGVLIDRIVLFPAAESIFAERDAIGVVSLSLSRFTARAANSGENPPPPLELKAPEPTDAEKLALKAAQSGEDGADLLTLLKDRNETVRMNAAAALERIKLPGAGAALIDLAKGASTLVAPFALRALAFQDADAAMPILRAAVERGVFDVGRETAAEILAEGADPKMAGPISSMMTARSPFARAAAASAIGKIKTKEAGMILLALLQEEDAAARLAVVRNLDPTLELVCRRLMWYSINDSSERVRLNSYLQLMKASSLEFRAGGYQGARDESPWVKQAVLLEIARSPTEEARAALQRAVIDPSPAVRAAALTAFKGLNKVEPKEVENVFADQNPVVQAALLELVATKALPLPDATVLALKSSLDRDVAARAKEILK